jgi:hypothetical protein
MIKRYYEFLNESLELILESDVVYSEKFRKALSKIDSTLSKTILDLENKDLPVRSNYFDIPADKNDKITFTPDDKAQSIISKSKNLVNYIGDYGWLKHSESNQSIFNRLGYSYSEGEQPYKPNNHDIGLIINSTLSETSGNKYTWVKWKNPDGDEVGEGVYNHTKLRDIGVTRDIWNKGRQEVKIGKAIRALLKTAKVDFLDKDIEEFVNSFKSTIDILNDKFSYFEVVSGDDIAYWYKSERYERLIGTLGSSCMRNVNSRYFEIYTMNPEVCSLIILKSQNDPQKITARALLWTLKSGDKFVDRVYTNDDSDVNLFHEYSKMMGWYSKYHNNSIESVKAFNPNGEIEEDLDGTITIKPGYYNSYPYMDTFKKFTPRGILSIYNGDYTLEQTNGRLEDDDDECERCGGEGNVECYECDGFGRVDCGECDGYDEVDCEECDGSGEVDDPDSDDKKSCEDCAGSGKKECTNCDNGRVDCEECDGSGERECNECN